MNLMDLLPQKSCLYYAFFKCPLTMQSLYDEKESKYIKSRTKHISQNIAFIAQHHRPQTPRADVASTYTKSAIPVLFKMPRYILYTHTAQSIYTKDDGILRFIPYIPKKGKIEGSYFDGISFASQKLDRKSMIVRSMVKELLESYTDDDLHKAIKTRKDEKIEEVAAHAGLSVESIVEWLREMFYRRRRRVGGTVDMMDYFCGVCFLFDCCIHKPVKDNGVRKEP